MSEVRIQGRPAAAPAALAFAPARVLVEPLEGGGFVLSSPQPLGAHEDCLGGMLDRWAAAAPERLFLAERQPEAGWRRLTYGEAAAGAAAVAQALLDRGLGPERPVMVLSGNAIDHALLMLGCFKAGVPIAPVSPAYSLMSKDFSKLRYIAELVDPGLIYVTAVAPFLPALQALQSKAEIVASGPGADGMGCTRFADLLATTPTAAVERAAAAVGPDSLAKILFTSGSTGVPKGVINTHRMLCANQQMLSQCWPFLEEGPPVLLDWLPWNHTFGGNHNFNMVLAQGGSLFIDAGKPAPGLIEHTVANLREVSPSIYFNVPAGYAMLLPYLERDPELAGRFFAELKLIFYAAAALPQDLWSRLEALSLTTLGRRVPMTSAWGSTETAPLATSAHFPLDRAGVIGLPVPGVRIKMVPSGGKLELRVKGANVTPGYYKRPDLTANAFDAEGYYCIGDAGRLADPEDAAKGILFDGRIAEDFKLDTGTWVHVGAVRVAVLAAASPLLQDAVVCGHDRPEIGILAWPNLAACRSLAAGLPADADIGELLRHPAVTQPIRAGIEAYNREQPASSTRVGRIHLLAEPPSIDANEITDKGYINQRATLDRRAALVERLFAVPAAPDVMAFE